MKIPFKRGVERNQGRQCNVKGCFKPRWSVSSYCYTHTDRNKRHGDPEGRCVYLSDYAVEFERIADLISRNEDHPGIKDALAKCEYVLHQGREGRGDVPGLEWIHRAVIHSNPSAEWLLTTIGALCLLNRYTGSLVRKEKALHMATAWQLFRMGKCKAVKLYGKTTYKSHKPKDRIACGQYLYRLVGTMAHNLADKAYSKMVNEQHSSVLQAQKLR